MKLQYFTSLAVKYQNPLRFSLCTIALSLVLWLLTVLAFPRAIHGIVQIIDIAQNSESSVNANPQEQIARFEQSLLQIRRIDSTQQEADAAPHIVRYVMDAARTDKASLSGIQASEPAQNADYTSYSLSFQGNARFKDFHTFVHHLETGSMIVSIDHLEIVPLAKTEGQVQFQMTLTIFTKRAKV